MPQRKPRGPHTEQTALMAALDDENSPEAIAAIAQLEEAAASTWRNDAPRDARDLIEATEADEQ